MSCEKVACAACGETVESAKIISVNVSGQSNHVQLYVCEGCAEEVQAVPDWLGYIGTLVARGLKRLAGIPSDE